LLETTSSRLDEDVALDSAMSVIPSVTSFRSSSAHRRRDDDRRFRDQLSLRRSFPARFAFSKSAASALLLKTIR
jgi:hypothetical protein